MSTPPPWTPRPLKSSWRLTNQVIQGKSNLTAMMVTHNLRHALEYGDRMLMMNRGHIVLDRSGAEKAATSVDDVLQQFNALSLDSGT